MGKIVERTAPFGQRTRASWPDVHGPAQAVYSFRVLRCVAPWLSSCLKDSYLFLKYAASVTSSLHFGRRLCCTRFSRNVAHYPVTSSTSRAHRYTLYIARSYWLQPGTIDLPLTSLLTPSALSLHSSCWSENEPIKLCKSVRWTSWPRAWHCLDFVNLDSYGCAIWNAP